MSWSPSSDYHVSITDARFLGWNLILRCFADQSNPLQTIWRKNVRVERTGDIRHAARRLATYVGSGTR